MGGIELPQGSVTEASYLHWLCRYILSLKQGLGSNGT